MNDIAIEAMRQFHQTSALDKLHDALCKPDVTLDLCGIKIGVKGTYYPGCGIGYIGGEPINPPEPSEFEIDAVLVGGVDILHLLADYAQPLLDHIETLCCEACE